AARSKGGDEDHRDAKADKADSRVSVRSKTKGGADDDRRAAKADDDDRRDAKPDSASIRVSGHHLEVSPSAAEVEGAIHSVPVPADVELAERLIRVERLPDGGVADRTTDSSDHVVENQEEPTPVTRAQRREVLVELLAIRVADRAERFLSPPDTEAGVAAG